MAADGRGDRRRSMRTAAARAGALSVTQISGTAKRSRFTRTTRHREANRLAVEVALASMPLRSGSEAALACGLRSDALPPCQSANAMIA